MSNYEAWATDDLTYAQLRDELERLRQVLLTNQCKNKDVFRYNHISALLSTFDVLKERLKS